MALELSLADTRLSWKLDPAKGKTRYTIGTNRVCDVRLPADPRQTCTPIEIYYLPEESQWCLRRLSTTLETNSEVVTTPIFDQAQIRLSSSLLLLAQVEDIDTQITESPLITSTRLLCGHAYKEGIFGAFELLNQLRSDPYKSKFPKSSIDVDQVTRHSTQSILLSVLVGALVLFIVLIQAVARYFSGTPFELSPLLITSGIVSGLLIAFEAIFLRWFLAQKFLKKNYDRNFSIEQLEPLSNYFRQGIYQPTADQNMTIFGGFSPFLGAGVPIPQSKWTIPIVRKKAVPDLPAKAVVKTDNGLIAADQYADISVHQFYESVDNEIESLSLPGLEKRSQLFVNGFELPIDGKILESTTKRPASSHIDDPIWNEEQTDAGSHLRSYRVYQYTDKKRDYILSHFFRFYNAGEITFVESSAHILPGIDRQRYGLASTLDDSTFTRIVKTIIAGIFLGISQLYLLLALWYLVGFAYNLINWRSHDQKQRRAAELQEEYNYGLEQTLREYVAEPLDLEETRKLNPTRKANQGINFFAKLNLRKIVSNPILLLLLFVLGPLLLPFAIFITITMWFLNRYKATVGTVNSNLDYYGTQDVFMYWKAIQDAIFLGTIECLQENGVDTTKLEGISAQIINNAITVSAGNIHGSQVVVGTGITATQSQAKSRA